MFMPTCYLSWMRAAVKFSDFSLNVSSYVITALYLCLSFIDVFQLIFEFNRLAVVLDCCVREFREFKNQPMLIAV
jgi:hypothetical protein